MYFYSLTVAALLATQALAQASPASTPTPTVWAFLAEPTLLTSSLSSSTLSTTDTRGASVITANPSAVVYSLGCAGMVCEAIDLPGTLTANPGPFPTSQVLNAVNTFYGVPGTPTIGTTYMSCDVKSTTSVSCVRTVKLTPSYTALGSPTTSSTTIVATGSEAAASFFPLAITSGVSDLYSISAASVTSPVASSSTSSGAAAPAITSAPALLHNLRWGAAGAAMALPLVL